MKLDKIRMSAGPKGRGRTGYQRDLCNNLCSSLFCKGAYEHSRIIETIGILAPDTVVVIRMARWSAGSYKDGTVICR